MNTPPDASQRRFVMTHHLREEVNLYEICPSEKREKLEKFLIQLAENLAHKNLYTQLVENP